MCVCVRACVRMCVRSMAQGPVCAVNRGRVNRQLAFSIVIILFV